MAKQSGLHQIRGKVGEHSYYRQTGVTNGLIRSINQGMSSRVKTSDEYANTRLNNAEFGQAGRIAKVLGRLVTPKYRPMILPFSQSKMAKIILESIKTDTAPWGQRNLSSNASDRIQAMVNALNAVSKGDFYEFGITVTTGELNQIIVSAQDALFEPKLAGIGADGCNISIVQASPFIGKYINNREYADSYARGNIKNQDFEVGDTSVSFVRSFPSPAPEGSIWMSGNFFVIVVMPYRMINNQSHILQEHCTFNAMAIPS